LKEKIPISIANRLINSGPVVLVTTSWQAKSNIITIAWQTPVSHTPMLVAISVGKTRYSHELLEKSKEFVINIPTVDLLKQVDFCGNVSGRSVDKFKESGLTPIKAEKVDAPLIKECIGHLECKLVETAPCGDHTIFIGEVVAAWVEKGLFDGYWLVDKAKLIHHLGGTKYNTPDKRISP